MGNPAILNQEAPDEARPLPPPTLPDVLWMVFTLRDASGTKRPRDEVLRCGQVGRLTLWRDDFGALNARLEHPSGYPTLLNLYRARIQRLDRRGLLLYGEATYVASGSVKDVPQSWWCVVTGIHQSVDDDAVCPE